MKKVLIVILSFFLIYLSGCTGEGHVQPITLYDFIGDWYMEGTLDLNIEDREFTQDLDVFIYFREGHISDNYGYSYTATLNNGVLILTRDIGFNDRDDFCGYFEGGTDATFMFINVNPKFNQAYAGNTMGETAVFTEHCNYKTLHYHGTVYLRKAE